MRANEYGRRLRNSRLTCSGFGYGESRYLYAAPNSYSLLSHNGAGDIGVLKNPQCNVIIMSPFDVGLSCTPTRYFTMNIVLAVGLYGLLLSLQFYLLNAQLPVQGNEYEPICTDRTFHKQ